MTLREVKDILDARAVVGENVLDSVSVTTAFSADLMSDVLAIAAPGCMLLTGLTSPQAVRTASILDIAAIVLVRGKTPPKETIDVAHELEIPILSTDYILFETSGRLFAKGIVGCVRKVIKQVSA
ncbi:MAG: hypothetical protein JW884_06035 [Deltaproteobacteria bacterium]|nr:hypothetical protein [Deltaproteobacteria bacterium]